MERGKWSRETIIQPAQKRALRRSSRSATIALISSFDAGSALENASTVPPAIASFWHRAGFKLF
jgi:hypothetical protein